MIILDKGERASDLWGREDEYITDKEIEALKEGKRLELTVMEEYVVVIHYKKGER